VDDAGRVGGRQRPGRLADQPGHLGHAGPAAGEFLQGDPLNEFQDQEGAALVLAEGMDGADVGVVQRRGRPRLAQEESQPVGVPGVLRRQELQGDVPAQARLTGLVDDAHAAAAQQAQILIAGNLGRGLRPRVRRRQRRVPASDRRPGDLVRQFGAVLGKALQILVESESGLATPAQLVLDGDQLEGDFPVAGQFRVAGQVLFDPTRLPGLQAQFQVDVHQFDQHAAAERSAGGQVVVDGRSGPLTPAILEPSDGVPQRQPILGGRPMADLGPGEHVQ
jgi:hypothetical protein